MSNKIEASGIHLPHRPYARVRSQALLRGLGGTPVFLVALPARAMGFVIGT